jgi:hypothetical protein
VFLQQNDGAIQLAILVVAVQLIELEANFEKSGVITFIGWFKG